MFASGLIVYEQLTEYLKETPVNTQSPEQIADFMQAISHYNLTKAEKLQMLNLRPKSAVEIYLVKEINEEKGKKRRMIRKEMLIHLFQIIEECEERFGEEDLENMLNTILQTIPRDDDEVMEGEEGEEAEGYDEGEVAEE